MGTVALGIRHVLCAPLRLVRYLDRADLPSETKTTGVLYLDSREKGSLLSANTRDRARHAGDRSRRRDRERAPVSPDARTGANRARAAASRRKFSARCCRPAATSARSTRRWARRCRRVRSAAISSISPIVLDGSFGFAVGDVSGKGPAAALLTAKIQGLFSAPVRRRLAGGDDPDRQQRPDAPRGRSQVRDGVSRDARPDGLLTYCNAGHNPPIMFGAGGLRRLESGSMPVGFFEHRAVRRTTTEQLAARRRADRLQRRRHRSARHRRPGVRRGTARRASLEQRHTEDAAAHPRSASSRACRRSPAAPRSTTT